MKKRKREWKRFGRVWGFEVWLATQNWERRTDLTQSSQRKSAEGTEKTAEAAQVLENVEIARGLRTKDYRPRGQARRREKAQVVVVVVWRLCN
jgi:hypothetical protein